MIVTRGISQAKARLRRQIPRVTVAALGVKPGRTTPLAATLSRQLFLRVIARFM